MKSPSLTWREGGETGCSSMPFGQDYEKEIKILKEEVEYLKKEIEKIKKGI